MLSGMPRRGPGGLPMNAAKTHVINDFDGGAVESRALAPSMRLGLTVRHPSR
jgi:hypothetical protein